MDMEKLIAFRNSHNPFCARLGVTLEEMGEGWARVRKAVTEEDLNPVGVAHGGLYYTMADNACGFAASLHGYKPVTLSGSYNYFKSALPGDVITAEAREVKSGRTILVFDVQITREDRTLLGTGTFTFYLLPEKLEIE